MSQNPVSVYIITKNEESRIGTAVRSVANWADEVIVVDSGSTDQTVRIARSLGARVIQRDWEGYGPQKRFAEEQCRNQWVLNIDADEEVSVGLAAEIQRAVDFASDDQAAFQIRVTDLLPGESAPRWHAYSYNVLRLYNRHLGQMSNHSYRDRVKVNGGRTSRLRNRILHRSFVSWESTLGKINFYTTQVAHERFNSGARISSSLRLWTAFPWRFIQIWVGRRYIFRGSIGFAMSITVAYLSLMRLLKTNELLQKQSHETSTAAGPMSNAA